MDQFLKTWGQLLITSFGVLAAFTFGFVKLYRTSRKGRRGKVETKCEFTPNAVKKGAGMVQTGPAWLSVEAVNHGPEDITIRALRGRYEDGSISNIGPSKTLRLGERYSRGFMSLSSHGDEYGDFYNEAGSVLVDLWFEDTLDRKHSLKHIKKYLKEIRPLM